MSATYMIRWSTRDHAKSINQFHSHGGDTTAMIAAMGTPGIKVVNSWHVLGKGEGYLTVSVDEPPALQACLLVAKDVFDMQVDQVLTDAEASKASAPFLKAHAAVHGDGSR